MGGRSPALSGLGLATVYGIVNPSDGYVGIGSELGQGTTVTIWLPHADDATDGEPVSELDLEPSRGHERILLVEDEADVRDFARDVPEHYGYAVLEAKDAEEALGAGHVREPGANLLQKPFTPEQLALSVRRVIDGLSLTTRRH